MEQLQQFAAAGYLYALLDATGHPGVPQKAQELGERAVSLFQGTPEENYWDVAPYLFQVDESTLSWIHSSLNQEPWGVFAMSRAGIDDLRRHFRRFLLVELPDGERWYFRYYDPRILKVYLPACDETELRQFFGHAESGVRAFGLADPDTRKLLFIHRPDAGVSLVAPEAAAAESVADLLWKIRPAQIAALEAAASEQQPQPSAPPSQG